MLHCLHSTPVISVVIHSSYMDIGYTLCNSLTLDTAHQPSRYTVQCVTCSATHRTQYRPEQCISDILSSRFCCNHNKQNPTSHIHPITVATERKKKNQRKYPSCIANTVDVCDAVFCLTHNLSCQLTTSVTPVLN